MSRTTGGDPAFPVSYGPDGTPGYAEGMTLRDWFAGQALAGTMSNAVSIPKYAADANKQGISMSDQIAEDCYMFADAMIAERDKP